MLDQSNHSPHHNFTTPGDHMQFDFEFGGFHNLMNNMHLTRCVFCTLDWLLLIFRTFFLFVKISSFTTSLYTTQFLSCALVYLETELYIILIMWKNISQYSLLETCNALACCFSLSWTLFSTSSQSFFLVWLNFTAVGVGYFLLITGVLDSSEWVITESANVFTCKYFHFTLL